MKTYETPLVIMECFEQCDTILASLGVGENEFDDIFDKEILK